MKNVIIAGAAGRMGRAIAKELNGNAQLKLVGAVEHQDSPYIGQDLGELVGIGANEVLITTEVNDLSFDLLIDFTRPDSTMKNLQLCSEQSAAIVVGTTGLDQEQRDELRRCGATIPVLLAANTSVGVNLCAALVETAARVLGDVVDIEIVEAHHRHKIDAPSGTALFLGESVAKALGRNLPEDGVFERYGNTGERPEGTIGFSTIRGGDIAGEHTVMFIGESERLEITHRATDRQIFARGAVRAASWLSQQPAGFYDMRGALGLT